MGSVLGEGIGKGIWVLYEGNRWWLSEFSREDFENCKSNEMKGLIFAIEKDDHDLSVPLEELELAGS